MHKFSKLIVALCLFGSTFSFSLGQVAAMPEILRTNQLQPGMHVKAENLKAESLPSSLTGLSGLLSADLGINGKGEDLSTAEVYGTATLRSGAYQGIGMILSA